ncbi:phosphoribosyltransferase [Aphanothece hegewaldii CCALA 016]|uniref:Phosphoribosyltransferase n=1 Tax=Aphanothece hegewaldii CCALA 016 TaxID=2107694 RepID=A0A2T1M2A3_9CHRO|nr:phosphoribosyltransferase family protein [Aphanothece hegewaldii]PSF38870.1 phosphoribosyltransferase [Aphanothece hegewaldii CCALA 016]
MSDLYVSWDVYNQEIEKLAVLVYQSQWEFDQIVCIAKGGLRVGDILSRLFRKPLGILSTSSYTGEENKTRGELTFSKYLSMTTEKMGNRILLVDDLADSGITLLETINWLKNKFPDEVQEVRTAVLWYKDSSVIKPDYYVEYLPDNPWIHQPFERYEQITPAEL